MIANTSGTEWIDARQIVGGHGSNGTSVQGMSVGTGHVASVRTSNTAAAFSGYNIQNQSDTPRSRFRRRKRLLLVGWPCSGKSLFRLQARRLVGRDAMSSDERRHAASCIQRALVAELLSAFSTVIEREKLVLEMDALDVMDSRVQEAHKTLQQAYSADLIFASSGYYDEHVTHAIKTMLRDKRLRTVLLARAKRCAWLRYCMAIASDVVSENWLPSDEDILSAWMPTVGMESSIVTTPDGVDVDCIEIGGGESLTRTMFREMYSAAAVLYFVSAEECYWDEKRVTAPCTSLSMASTSPNTSSESGHNGDASSASTSSAESAKQRIMAHFRAVCGIVARAGLPFILVITLGGRADHARGEALRDELMSSLRSQSPPSVSSQTRSEPESLFEFWQPSSMHIINLADSDAFVSMFGSVMVGLGLRKLASPEEGRDVFNMGPLDAGQQIAALQGELSVNRSQLNAVKGDREHEALQLAELYKSNTARASQLQLARDEADKTRMRLESVVADVREHIANGEVDAGISALEGFLAGIQTRGASPGAARFQHALAI